MVRILNQDLLSDIPPNTIILHQVNCIGVMGSGLALQIRNKWSKVYSEYRDFCNEHLDPLGKIQLIGVEKDIILCNAFGQHGISWNSTMTDYDAWRDKILPSLGSMLELLEKKTNEKWNVRCPYGIGCGLGGGNWNIMLGLIENQFKDSKFEFHVCKR